MGFIGLGGQGSGHLFGGGWTYVPGGYVAREDVQVLAVCDVRKERRERAHERATTSTPTNSTSPAITASSPIMISGNCWRGRILTPC